MRIDPRDFIAPPFQACPQCHRESFGVLMIPGQHYVRRCRECRHTARIQLPPIRKTVIYLDQFAISNMMLALNPATDAHRARRVDPAWLQLFRRLDHVAKVQLVVCPDSGFHWDESLVSPYYSALRRLYELLSGGATFRDASYIEQFQLIFAAKAWMSGQSAPGFDLHARDVVDGELDRWWEKFQITANMNIPPEWLDDLRCERDRAHEIMGEVFERWQQERPSFEDVFSEEVRAYGQQLLRGYLQHLQRFHRVLTGQEAPSLELLGTPPVRTLHEIRDALRESGVEEQDLWPKTAEFLASTALTHVPFLRLRCMLFAAVARKAAAGQQRPPSRGFATDALMVSCLLPYCEAMLVDNGIAAYLAEQPLVSEVQRYGTQVFSFNTRDGFFGFLDRIEAGASPEHLEMVRTVYGPDWGQPFETVYQQEDHENL